MPNEAIPPEGAEPEVVEAVLEIIELEDHVDTAMRPPSVNRPRPGARAL